MSSSAKELERKKTTLFCHLAFDSFDRNNSEMQGKNGVDAVGIVLSESITGLL